jgi:coproporphyrinogen III oxidase-like Fe-S oxidoreductase
VHVPFCERLCPYCSFNRFPFDEARARAYFKALRAEMRMLCGRGYDFKSMYVGGGTPTVLIDELTALIDEARALFGIEEVSCETNPNHLTPERLEVLEGRVQRLSVGVQSFDDGLLRQIGRHEAYGSGLQTLERLQAAARHFDTINADMIFNFPSQTEDQLVYDLACILESGVAQTTFYPLMASPSVARSLRQTVGQVSHAREHRYYQLVSAALCGEGPQPLFEFSSAWTFNAVSASTDNTMIDEYIVDYEEYPALGSGGFSYLDGSLYVNTFSVNEYIRLIGEGRMSVKGVVRFSRYDRMRYRLMMQLFGLRLDKRQWESDFGCSVASGVPVEYAFYRTAGAFARETADEIVLSTKGRYLLVALMRQFFVGVNGVRDRARASLPDAERLLFECLDDGQ